MVAFSVKDESTLEPGTEETALLQMRLMKEDRVLVNTDGKFESVVKFKPPMCFNKADADWACKAIDRVSGIKEFPSSFLNIFSTVVACFLEIL